MKNYELNQNEIILFRDEIILLLDGKKAKNKTKTELLLTNENFVFINKNKKLFQKESIDTVVVPIKDMKVYNDMPYMVRKENLIEIYTSNGEYFLEFEKKKQAKEFFNKTMRVASGYSKFVRGVKKVTKEIKDTNEALEIDIVDTTKKTFDIAVNSAIEYSEISKGSKAKLIGTVAKVFKKHKTQDNQKTEEKTQIAVLTSTETEPTEN